MYVYSPICKFLIGANKYSSNFACKSEVGEYPLAISAALLSKNYWMHINGEIPKSHNKFTFQSLINVDEIKSSYGEQIKDLLKIIGFDHVWQNKGHFSKRSLTNDVE